jgi:hypothetical protein
MEAAPMSAAIEALPRSNRFAGRSLVRTPRIVAVKA